MQVVSVASKRVVELCTYTCLRHMYVMIRIPNKICDRCDRIEKKKHEKKSNKEVVHVIVGVLASFHASRRSNLPMFTIHFCTPEREGEIIR
jgi:hypothetical protein